MTGFVTRRFAIWAAGLLALLALAVLAPSVPAAPDAKQGAKGEKAGASGAPTDAPNATEAGGGTGGSPADESDDSDDDAIVVISGPAIVEEGVTVEGVVVIHGRVQVDGTVDGDVYILDGDATVTGTIDGDLSTMIGTAFVEPGATVTGDVLYGDEEPVIADGADVGGSVKKEDWDDAAGAIGLISAVALWLAMTISALILGIVLVLALPRAADAIVARSREGIGVPIAIGLAALIGLPLIAAGAAATLVGLPLAVAIFFALLPLAALAYVAAAWALGRAIVKEPRGRVLAFLAGLAILRAIALIPVVGVLAWLIAVAIGLGLILRAIGAARKESPATATAPAAAT